MQRVLWLLGLSLFTMLVHVGTTRAENGVVRGQIVNLMPQGRKSVVIVNRGLRFGIRVGQVARCGGARKFLCKVTEVYEHRSKCIADLETRDIEAYGCDFEAPPRTTTRLRVLEVVPEGETTTLVVDQGHLAGVSLADWVEVAGQRCRLWRIENDRAACSLDEVLSPGALDKVTLVSPLLLPSGPLGAPLIAPPPRLDHKPPRRGARQAATPVSLVRAPTHGLVAASPCIGFTPDERSAYVLQQGAVGLAAWPGERGLDLQRIDFATGGATTVQTFSPAQVSTARRQLAEFVIREGLLACHEAEDAVRSSAGAKGLMAHHTLDRILFWEDDSVIYAAMEGGAGLAERVGVGALPRLWFVPGVASHLGQAGDRWQVFDVR